MYLLVYVLSFPGGSDIKSSACNVGDPALIPELGRSPGEGSGNPPQYSCLENPMNRGAWWATVHGVSPLSDWVHYLSKLSNLLNLVFGQRKNYNWFLSPRNLPKPGVCHGTVHSHLSHLPISPSPPWPLLTTSEEEENMCLSSENAAFPSKPSKLSWPLLVTHCELSRADKLKKNKVSGENYTCF